MATVGCCSCNLADCQWCGWPTSSPRFTEADVRLAGEFMDFAAEHAKRWGVARTGTVRPESVYEMDLSEAGYFDEPEYRSGRMNYRSDIT